MLQFLSDLSTPLMRIVEFITGKPAQRLIAVLGKRASEPRDPER